MHERVVAFYIAIAVLMLTGIFIQVRWRRQPGTALLVAGVVTTLIFSLGLYYGITDSWAFGLGLGGMAVPTGAVFLMIAIERQKLARR
jgi:uncharacterized membrane protein